MSKRQETRWIEIDLTEYEAKLLCRASGISIKAFETGTGNRVENFVRKAAIGVAKRVNRIGKK